MRRILRSLLRCVTRRRHRREEARAVAAWRDRRNELENRFLHVAESPRGLRWGPREWTGEVRFARDRAGSVLTAFSGLVASFEPVEGGEMEGVEAAGMPRDATTVFHFRAGTWETDGRVLFNLTPGEALARMADRFDPVDPPPA